MKKTSDDQSGHRVSELPPALSEMGRKIDWVPAGESGSYLDDPRDRFAGLPLPVFRPVSTEEVSALVKVCNRERIGIIPYSGGTGVVAGQLALSPGKQIGISLERMNRVRAISLDDSAITAEAGCILADLQKIADDQRMIFPLSMASEGSARLGGNLATNCGGIQVLRYGNARDLCLGIEAVLPDGSVFDGLSPLRKNNTGYDLRHLLIGSEGTLGIITAASMKLEPPDESTSTAFCTIASPATALALLNRFRNHSALSATAFEIMCDFGLRLVEEKFPEEAFPLSTRASWYVLLEIGGPQDATGMIEEILSAGIEEGMITDAVIASSLAQRNALWRLRELTPEANRLAGAICNSDTAVPLSTIGNFIAMTHKAIAEIDPSLPINCYGHVGDGNIHFNVFPPPGKSKADIIENEPDLIKAIRMAINDTSHRCGGSVSAEHGIGRLKVDDLERYANPVKLAAMRAIKQALDPNGIMNPGALLKS